LKLRKSELERLKRELQSLEKEKITIPKDPVEFMRKILGFNPTKYQLDLIEKFLKHQLVAVRWCRQSGKSHTMAALLLHYALTHPNINIGVVGPSWRQTKLVIRRINGFLQKIPKNYYYKPQRTIVRLKNGSVIEAFPNNPDTIRGPTLHIVYADEMNFIPNDEEMYDAILFTLGTTNGKFVCSSTPWNTDSVFWRIFNDPAFSDFAKSHITYKQALEPNGPLKREILEKIKKQLEGDPWRWRREMLAEWAEDENVWLPQSLIVSCIDAELTPYSFHDTPTGTFYLGVDFGKHQDYSVVVVCEKRGDTLYIVHVHRFPLETEYASVIGYIKSLRDRWQSIRAVYADVTGVGDYIVEDMKRAGITNTTGITFTVKSKEEMAQILREKMRNGQLKIPYTPKRTMRDIDLPSELNVERFELSKTGHIQFNHPQGTHDDVFWATALAVYAAAKEKVGGLIDFGHVI